MKIRRKSYDNNYKFEWWVIFFVVKKMIFWLKRPIFSGLFWKLGRGRRSTAKFGISGSNNNSLTRYNFFIVPKTLSQYNTWARICLDAHKHLRPSLAYYEFLNSFVF